LYLQYRLFHVLFLEESLNPFNYSQAQLEAKAGLRKPLLVHAILETALGVANVEEIAAASRSGVPAVSFVAGRRETLSMEAVVRSVQRLAAMGEASHVRIEAGNRFKKDFARWIKGTPLEAEFAELCRNSHHEPVGSAPGPRKAVATYHDFKRRWLAHNGPGGVTGEFRHKETSFYFSSLDYPLGLLGTREA
jgi:hypothetical protein